MLGVVGENRYVMGCISQLEDGKFFLEDLSASLPLDLSQAQVADGFLTGALCTHERCPIPSQSCAPSLSDTLS